MPKNRRGQKDKSKAKRLYKKIIVEQDEAAIGHLGNDIDLPLNRNGYRGDTSLFWAIELSLPRIITCLMIHGANPNTDVHTPSGMHTSPWRCAFKQKPSFQHINLMLNKANLNVTLPGGNTILHLLCSYDKSVSGSVRALITRIFERREQPFTRFNDFNNDGVTAAYCAIVHGNPELLDLLLMNGVSSENCERNTGISLLHLAIQHEKDIGLIRLLLQYTNDINFPLELNQTALHIACGFNRPDVVEELLSRGADINALTELHHTPLHIAAQRNALDCLMILLKHAADPTRISKDGQTAEDVALTYGNSECCSQLRACGVKAQQTISLGPEALLHCFQSKRFDFLDILKERGISLDKEYHTSEGYHWTILSSAIEFGQLESVRRLVEEGCDPNKALPNGEFPLSIAVRLNHQEIVAYLIEQKASLNKSVQGDTALHIAASTGNAGIVKCLLDGGADPTLQTSDGFNPLFIAIDGEKEAVATLLINETVLGTSAHINTLSQEGRTVLHHAVRLKQHSITALLLQRGADACMRTPDGWTAMAIAIEINDCRLFQLLQFYVDRIEDFSPDGDFHLLNKPLLFGRTNMVRAILSRFPNISMTESLYEHTIHFIDICVALNNDYLAELLLHHGADLEHAFSFDHGVSVKHYIRQNCSPRFQRLLVDQSEGAAITQASSERCSEIGTIGTHAFLRSMGYDDDSIHQIRKRNQKMQRRAQEKVSFWSRPDADVSINRTWLSGHITLQEFDMVRIRNSVNCYLIVDSVAILQDGCDAETLRQFRGIDPSFSSGMVKKIRNVSVRFRLLYRETSCLSMLSHELRLTSTLKRVLLFPILSDDGKATLYIGCKYLSHGLHHTADNESLEASSRDITLHLRPRESDDLGEHCGAAVKGP